MSLNSHLDVWTRGVKFDMIARDITAYHAMKLGTNMSTTFPTPPRHGLTLTAYHGFFIP